MSLASYLGCHMKIPLSDVDSTELPYVGRSYADEFDIETVRVTHFSTPFTYEVSGDWGIEITEYTDESMISESKEKLIALCGMMKNHLAKGEYFELYTCWIGEEAEQSEGELSLSIHFTDFEKIKIPEKTIIRFEK